MKVAIVCSKGGHLTEALQIMDALKAHDVFFVTNKHTTTENIEHKTYYIRNIWTSPFKMFLAFFDAIRILFKEKPDVIFSTGAEPAIPFFIVGRLLGKKTIFLETITRVKTPTKTGKIVYPFTSLFLVQWPELKEKFGKRAVYEGGIIK